VEREDLGAPVRAIPAATVLTFPWRLPAIRGAARARSRSCYGVAMELDAPSGVPLSEVNPNHIVPVTNFSADTLWSIIAHMEVSTDFEHLVYREAELDAIWSITGFFLVTDPNSSQLEAVRQLRAGAHKAHDLVADRRPAEAAEVLRSFL
jgi:hypothetical protein